MSRTDPARSWWQDEPSRMAAERAAMAVAAPDLVWLSSKPSGGWQGDRAAVAIQPTAAAGPIGAAGRPAPGGADYLRTCPPDGGAERPAASVKVPFCALGWTHWHVAPDETLCLLQESAQWDPSSPAADLIPKISGWHVEFWLMKSGHIEAMTECGIAEDDSLDGLLAELGQQP
jgi:hypothetical protein